VKMVFWCASKFDYLRKDAKVKKIITYIYIYIYISSFHCLAYEGFAQVNIGCRCFCVTQKKMAQKEDK
jgi:hypothetical protein